MQALNLLGNHGKVNHRHNVTRSVDSVSILSSVSAINLKEVVKLPPGEDLNDWLAVHGTSAHIKHCNRLPRSVNIVLALTYSYIIFYNCV